MLKSKRARGALLKITFPVIIIFWSIFNNGMRQITIISPSTTDLWINSFGHETLLSPCKNRYASTRFNIYHIHISSSTSRFRWRANRLPPPSTTSQNNKFARHAIPFYPLCIYAAHMHLCKTRKLFGNDQKQKSALRSHCWLLIAMKEKSNGYSIDAAYMHTRVRHDKQ